MEFSASLCIPLPDREYDVKDSIFKRNQVLELKKEWIKIDVFCNDLVKISEVSALLMIVDDNGKNEGKKRMTLLNKYLKYSELIVNLLEKNFYSIFSFF